MTVVLVALAGGVGAVTRFAVDGAVKARLTSEFPWATVLINVTGSFLLGLLVGWVAFRDGSNTVEAVLGTGFCGGYTTFSTASFETVRLLQRQRYGLALGNALGTAGLAVAAAAAGLAVAAL